MSDNSENQSDYGIDSSEKSEFVPDIPQSVQSESVLPPEKNEKKPQPSSLISNLNSDSSRFSPNSKSILYVSTSDSKSYNETRGSSCDTVPEDQPFTYDGKFVRYSKSVSTKASFLLGSNGALKKKVNSLSYLVFSPKSGTLGIGTVTKGKKLKNIDSSNFSLIAGLNNHAELDGSLVTGSENSILLELLADNKDKIPITSPSCGIIGGVGNTITQTNLGIGCSVIGASRGAKIKDCDTTVVLGLNWKETEQPLIGYKESTFTRDIYILGKQHVGPIHSVGTSDAISTINGSQLITENVTVEGNVDSSSGSFKKLVSEEASFHNITVTNIVKNSVSLTGTEGTETKFTINPGDGISVIYANPLAGVIDIQLGTGGTFEENRSLFIKDSCPEFATGFPYNSHNIKITSGNPGVTGDNNRIEHYTQIPGGGALITSSVGGTYVLNSAGGAVTFRYMASKQTWVIENQLIGNPRILQTTGIKFLPASEGARNRVMKRSGNKKS